MAKLARYGSAISVIALAAALGGCAAPTARSGSAFKGKNADIGLATRAQMALGAGDFAGAIDYAERAVEKTPNAAVVRALLGNIYFASGRFASAEAAYGDSLSLSPAQPQIILKLALVRIAQGKNGAAIALLESAGGMLDAADHGLALALAGQPDAAVQVLEPAARTVGADSRVRQNLALAYGLAGDWAAARTIAAQDLSPDLVDSRVQQWMALAKPARASDQVAALVGIAPAAADPGQPVRIALNQSETRLAAVTGAPVAAPAPQPEVAVAAPSLPQPQSAYEAPPVQLASAEPAPAPLAPIAAPAYEPAPVQAAAAEAPVPAFLPTPAPRKVLARAKARAAAAQLAKGKSNSVVQLGAYKSPERVSVAWQELTARYPALKAYAPLRARFDTPNGPVWRLSIRGFDNQQEAIARCQALKGRGGSCFVRSTAGDAPVQFASR